MGEEDRISCFEMSRLEVNQPRDEPHAEGPAVIEVQAAYLRYKNGPFVLNGISISVPEGAIYGLIGPSGCGKTTLINVILGIKKLNSGRVYVKCPIEKIGFMPQEAALHEEFSIGETLYYYGHIFSMNSKAITDRSQELIEFLELPHKNSVISSMSGGEKRRVSLCIALLHNPQLLILDEPTVGMDPILSTSIWSKLSKISKTEGKTILLTTHYIEETKNSDKIGLMREGIMLTENVPSMLMAEQNCETIEQAFLSLINRQNLSSQNKNDQPLNAETDQTTYKMRMNRCLSGQRIWAMLIKNLYWMKRNYSMILFLIMLPGVQCVLMNLTVGREPEGLRVAIVNDELPSWEIECGNVTKSGCSKYMQKLSCSYLEQLRLNKVKAVRYDEFDEAVKAARKNHVWGVLHFSQNYTASLINRIELAIMAPSYTVQHSQLEIWLDMSNNVIGNSLKSRISFAFTNFLKNVYKDCEHLTGGASLPIKFNPLYGSNNPSLVHFTTPAVIVLAEFYFPIMFSVGAVLMDRLDGILMRTLVAGVKFVEILIVHMAIQYVLLIIQTIIMMVILFGIFDNPLEGSIPLCSVLLFLVGTAGTAFGLLLAMICDSFSSATFAALGSYFPLFLFSGMIWPMEGMHYVLRTIGYVLPLTLSIESFRAMTTKAWSIDNPTVYVGFLSSFSWTLILTVITLLAVKLSRDLRLSF